MPRTFRKPVKLGRDVLACIYEDNHGYEIIVQRKGQQHRERFDRGTPKPTLKAHRQRIIDDLVVRAAKSSPGTLAGDAARYLETIQPGRTRDDRENELQAWIAQYGATKRAQLTTQDVRVQLATWRAAGLKPSTLNHRRQALRSLYKTLDGPDAPTPCDHIPKYQEERIIRDVPRACVIAILRQLPRTKNGARIKVIARTGLPHVQVGKIQRADLRLTTRDVSITPRRKGAGAKARRVPLTHAAVRAFREFDRLDAYGPFSNSSLHKVFQQAVKDAIDKWPGRWPGPTKIRPYDLRHAFLSEVYRRTKDLRATAELGLHASMTITARYAEAAVSDTASAARDAMDNMALRKNRPK